MTVTRMLGLILLLLLISVAACSGGGNRSTLPGIPTDTNEFLSGYLMDKDGNPLKEKPLIATDLEYNLLDETQTDSNGYFEFELDPSLEYMIFPRGAADSPDGGWKYSAVGGYAMPANPGDGGVVHPETGYRIWIPNGSIVAISPPDELYVDFGAGDAEKFLLRGTNGMVKILPSTSLNSLEAYMRLEGARGEHEAFQVIPKLVESVNSISNVEVQVSDLVKGNDRILKNKISVYKVHYVNVTEPSDMGGATGWWPDALVPLTEPFDVSKSFPSPVWIDVSIPYDAVPGVYNGQVKFITPSDGSMVFNYSLEVWNITFPKKFYMKATIGLNHEDIAYFHGLDTGLNTPAGRIMARKYAGFLAERHISPCGTILFPQVFLNPDRRSYYLDFTQTEADIVTFLDEYDLPAVFFPINGSSMVNDGFIAQYEDVFSSDYNARFLDYIQQVSTYLSNRGYLDRTIVLIIDEPNSAIQYEQVRQVSDLLNQASIKPRFMITEQPATSNPEWGSLLDSADIFTSCLSTFYFMGGEEIARAGGSDKEEWFYTGTTFSPFPTYALDKNGIEPRILCWFAYQHDFQGMMYYSATNWQETNVFSNPLPSGDYFGNGEGYLTYPGPICADNTGQDNVDGPITSIRLENIRDGLEDTQLMYMLANGDSIPAVEPLLSSWYEFCKDPKDLLAVRSDIADLIQD